MIQRSHHSATVRTVLCASFVTLMLSGMAGCAFAGDPLPADLKSRLESSTGTAEDHLAAARLYQQRAQQLEADAARYAREADSITPLEDTKGFRRNALKTAAREHQKEAKEMLHLFAEHERKAVTMTATPN